MENTTRNIRVREFLPLRTPNQIQELFPASQAILEGVAKSRQKIRDCISGESDKFLIICGPCSIHDQKAALEYAEEIKKLRNQYRGKLEIIMRVYFEKPRTTVGWKGLINDPHLDGSDDIDYGLQLARDILLSICNLGIPTATEFLDPITPQYISDLVSWAAIGARTTESQTHREMVSGLSMPTGFKNSTDGSFANALNAMVSAGSPHSFLGIDENGLTSIVKTKGNQDVHLVLRGGKSGPNYDAKSVKEAFDAMKCDSDERKILIDCSHGNSNKDFLKQPDVCLDVASQFASGNKSILGVMLESHINSGNQKLSSNLEYGKSITDGCIDLDTTKELLAKVYNEI